MSIAKLTETQARATILSQCRQFVEDTPAKEPQHEEEYRFENLAKFLSFTTGADIYEKATSWLDEVITTIQEQQSLDTGTHQDIELNESRTVDNRDMIRDRLDQLLADQLYSLLQAAAFRTAKKKVAA
ncbi:hypothetical protein [Arthrobacter bambusae]|uniref:hypothetical protein n=1 Tax=Arthrobacter bambusae TaxID=1338426 RepID=UPI00277E1FEA|nr:hypothetical protein [Arthrobacter bambusae]MDQ0241238.1 hypothetical protein [Arthrobacter bambusae]